VAMIDVPSSSLLEYADTERLRRLDHWSLILFIPDAADTIFQAALRVLGGTAIIAAQHG